MTTINHPALRNLLLAATQVALTLGLLVGSAAAQTKSTTTFRVSAFVEARCSVSASNRALGTNTGTRLDAASTITVSCSNATAYQVALRPGTDVVTAIVTFN
jgi:spore coat protein U-like protein